MGQYIHDCRKSKGLTQKQVGTLTGLETSTISGIELGYTKPSVNSLTKIALALQLDMNVLCGISRPRRMLDCDALSEKQITAIQIIVDELGEKNAAKNRCT